MKKQTIRCPYCGSTAILKNASVVYGNKASGGSKLYICSRYPTCDSYVGVHTNTNIPKGTLANKSLREKRILTHRTFDLIWKRGILTKPEAYHWMADKFGLNSKQAHIGNFSEYMCDQLIYESKKVLCNNHMLLKAAS